MLKNTKSNLKSIVIPAKRSVSGNPAECKALNTTGCPIRSGMTEESGRSTSSLSFPCLTRESTWCGPNAPRCAQYAQSGRSMVEMLGVLAIIGVLSVAGVGGYTAAMKRHRANELLNEASKRATIVAMQIAAGQEPSITEFDNNAALGFQTPTHNETDKRFTLTLTGVDEEVCEQMQVSAGIAGMIRSLTCGTPSNGKVSAELVFNDDLSNGTSSGNTPPEAPAISCPDGAGTDRTTYTGNPFTYTEGASSVTCYCPSGKMWDGEDCDTNCATSGSCTSNEGLCRDYYCEVNVSCSDDYCDVDENGDVIIGPDGPQCHWGCRISGGSVEELPSSIPTTTNGVNEYYESHKSMNWDTSYFYCQAVGRSLGENINLVTATRIGGLSRIYWTGMAANGTSLQPTDIVYTAIHIDTNGLDTWDSRNKTNFEGWGDPIYALCE